MYLLFRPNTYSCSSDEHNCVGEASEKDVASSYPIHVLPSGGPQDLIRIVDLR